jgi:hypothetical protein
MGEIFFIFGNFVVSAVARPGVFLRTRLGREGEVLAISDGRLFSLWIFLLSHDPPTLATTAR